MEPTVRANRFAILTSRAVCHACHQPLDVSAILVPSHFELDDGDEEWIAVDQSALLTYVESVDEMTWSAYSARAPQILPFASKTRWHDLPGECLRLWRSAWRLVSHRNQTLPYFPWTKLVSLQST
ncbi:MAG: hypothetical protein KGL63_08820 [Betaproteobacteria bacterium]|jgi:hypothetical protein|nr:hypothetical protein [Betaproteobacteria bacterium]